MIFLFYGLGLYLLFIGWLFYGVFFILILSVVFFNFKLIWWIIFVVNVFNLLCVIGIVISLLFIFNLSVIFVFLVFVNV